MKRQSVGSISIEYVSFSDVVDVLTVRPYRLRSIYNKVLFLIDCS
ncbi:MAG: hypothetical protein ACFNL1_05625 [Prevotella histicola]